MPVLFSCVGSMADYHRPKFLTGVGKSSLVHLLLKGSAVARPAQTIGCAVGVKVSNPGPNFLCFNFQNIFSHKHYFPFLQHITYSSPGSSSNSIKGDAERNFFVELWDVSGHERYKECRSLFYSQINGRCFLHHFPCQYSNPMLHLCRIHFFFCS